MRIPGVIMLSLMLLPLHAKKSEIVKSGWNLGPLPVVGFDSDLGFQYGVCCDLFNFGDGSNYPRYDFKVNLEASTYTKGSSILRVYGDFKNVIPDGKLFFDAGFFHDPKFGFYGFNGYASEFNPDKIVWKPSAATSEGAKSGYNYMSRKQFRVLVSGSKTISGKLSAAVGLAYYHIAAAPLKLSDYKGQNTLYEDYVSKGLIRENERDGGNVTQLRAGLVYDTRDHDSDPSRGLNIETSLVYAPDIIDGCGYSNLGWLLSFCHFIPLLESGKLVLAYRGVVQANLWGETPYYFTNNLNYIFFRKLSTEGLGGSASVRGLNRNGVLGESMAMLNFELRWHFLDFKFINQNWQLAANPFCDMGKILAPYRLSDQKAADLYYKDEKKIHFSAGIGFKLIMNHNMVLSFEGGKPFHKNDGAGLWTNVGFNYIF